MAKYVIFYLAVSLAVGPAKAQEYQDYKIDFTIKDIPDSSVYIGYFLGSQKYVFDTLQVNNDQFTLEGTGAKPLRQGLYFVYSPHYYLEFVVDGPEFSLRTTNKGGYKDLKITGSGENEIFKEFQLTLGGLQAEQKAQLKQLKSGNAKDSLDAVSALEHIDEEMKSFKSRLAGEHPNSFTVSFLNMMEEIKVPAFDEIADEKKKATKRYYYYRDHYFDRVDLPDERLLRTPLLHTKVMKYFDQVIPQVPDTIIREIDKFFDLTGDDPESFRYWLVTFVKKYEESNIMGMDAVTIHLIEHYYLTEKADWVTEEFEKKLREQVAFVKPNLIGKPAPRLDVVDTLLQPFFIEQVGEPYLVLFFYDPECGHCKKAIPVLKEKYDDLKDLGAEVLAICTITDVEKWKEFVREKGLEWINVADPYYQSSFRVKYDVRSTPRVYVLDQNRKIIAKQLDVDQLTDFIERYSSRN